MTCEAIRARLPPFHRAGGAADRRSAERLRVDVLRSEIVRARQRFADYPRLDGAARRVVGQRRRRLENPAAGSQPRLVARKCAERGYAVVRDATARPSSARQGGIRHGVDAPNSRRRSRRHAGCADAARPGPEQAPQQGKLL